MIKSRFEFAAKPLTGIQPKLNTDSSYSRATNWLGFQGHEFKGQGQGQGQASNRRNLVNLIAPEPLKAFEPKPTRRYFYYGLATNLLSFQGRSAKVTETFFGGGIPISGSPPTSV